MKRLLRCVLAVVLAVSAAAPAAPVDVEFAIFQSQAYGGQRRGVILGSWSFDSSLAKPNAVIESLPGGLELGSFSFRWLGHHWHPGNARLARLEFDAAGELRSWTIGGSVTSGGCGAVGPFSCVGAPSSAADFTLTATRLEPGIPPPAVVAVGVLPRMDSFAEAGGIFVVRKRVAPKRK